MITSRILASALLALGVLGCATDAGMEATPSVEVADSAGVRVVTLAESSPSDTLSPVRIWIHGGAMPDYLFQRIVSGVFRDDGAAIIVDIGADEVIRIDPDGVSHDIIARSGQGPREVRNPRKVVTGQGKDVWIEDFWGRKLLRLEGDSITTVLSGRDNPTAADRLMPIGVDSAGRIMLTTGGFMPGWEEEWLMGTLVTFEPGTPSADTVGSFEMAPRVGDPPVFPFGGYGVASATSTSFVTGRTDIAQLVWRSSDGAVFQIARWDAEARYAGDADWAEFEASIRFGSEQMNPGRSDEDYDAMAKRSLANYELDKTKQVRFFDDIVGGQDGSIWIAPFTASSNAAAAREWTVLSGEGEWLGVARFPNSIRILDVTQDAILGVQRDEFDVETVVVFANPF